MIELNDNDLKNFAGHSSKGNQLKWCQDNTWYKADYTGYEGLSEYMISNLISKSNLEPSEYILYETEGISYKHTSFKGAKSKDFLTEGDQLITLSRLYNNKYNRDFTKDLWHINETTNRLFYVQ